MENQITIQKETLLQSCQQATVEQKALLENIFGKDMFQPKDIRERVKTFEDACSELGETNVLVQTYRTASFDTRGDLNDVSDVLAYLKLRIISAALNEGWDPKFTKEKARWYPWFHLWTEEELKDKSDEWKTDNGLWLFGGASDYASSCGLASALSTSAWTRSGACSSARLAVKSEELAQYFGEQFIDIWADFLFTGLYRM